MAGISHEDVAELLTDIAKEMHKTFEENQDTVRLYLKVASLMTDFLDERSDGFCQLYDEKLISKLDISD